MLMFLASVLDQWISRLSISRRAAITIPDLAWLQGCLISEAGRKHLNDQSDGAKPSFNDRTFYVCNGLQRESRIR